MRPVSCVLSLCPTPQPTRPLSIPCPSFLVPLRPSPFFHFVLPSCLSSLLLSTQSSFNYLK